MVLLLCFQVIFSSASGHAIVVFSLRDQAVCSSWMLASTFSVSLFRQDKVVFVYQIWEALRASEPFVLLITSEGLSLSTHDM